MANPIVVATIVAAPPKIQKINIVARTGKPHVSSPYSVMYVTILGSKID